MTYFTKQSSTWSYTLHSQAWLVEMRDYPGPTSPPDLYLRQFDWAGLLVTSCFSGGQDYTVGRPSMWQVLWLAPLLFIELGSRYRGRILDPMEEQVSSIKSWYSTWYSILGTCQALGWWTLSQNFRSLPLMVWESRCFVDISKQPVVVQIIQ